MLLLSSKMPNNREIMERNFKLVTMVLLQLMSNIENYGNYVHYIFKLLVKPSSYVHYCSPLSSISPTTTPLKCILLEYVALLMHQFEPGHTSIEGRGYEHTGSQWAGVMSWKDDLIVVLNELYWNEITRRERERVGPKKQVAHHSHALSLDHKNERDWQ